MKRFSLLGFHTRSALVKQQLYNFHSKGELYPVHSWSSSEAAFLHAAGSQGQDKTAVNSPAIISIKLSGLYLAPEGNYLLFIHSRQLRFKLSWQQ